MKLKYMSNYISIFRILTSLSLLFIDLFTWEFITIYILGGVSDVLDGYVARKTNTESLLGAKLDTWADIIMFAAIIYIFTPVITLTNTLVVWLFAIFAIRVTSIIIAYFKFKVFAILHTLCNKTTGLFLFFIPILIGSSLEVPGLYFVCVVASVASIEELLIIILSKKIDINVKSLFAVHK